MLKYKPKLYSGCGGLSCGTIIAIIVVGVVAVWFVSTFIIGK